MSVHTTATRLAIVLLAIALLGSGGANLAGVPALHTSFAELGLPVWFGYQIGALEVAAGIGLFIPRLRAAAAVGVIIIMLGALYYHATMGHALQGIPALAILVLSAFLCWRQPKIEPL